MIWKPRNIPSSKVLDDLKTSAYGLSSEESSQRLQKHGANIVPEKKQRHILEIFLEQFSSPLVYILLIISVVSLFLGKYLDAVVIAVIVFVNGLLWCIQEYKAEKSIQALRKMLLVEAKVYRNNALMQIDASLLVPWDIIFVEEGDRIPADARILSPKNFSMIESSLTGESYAVSKNDSVLPEETPVADCKNMIRMSTFVAQGACTAVVTSTWINTIIGQIASDLQSMTGEPSSFQRKVAQLSKHIAIIACIAAFINLIIGRIHGTPRMENIKFAVASLVSWIPEWLPAILALVLAIGAKQLARKNAIVRTLTATETLGAVTTIATDKTWTLTQNTMTIQEMVSASWIQVRIDGSWRSPEGSFYYEEKLVHPTFDPAILFMTKMCSIRHKSVVTHIPEDNTYKVIGDPTEAALNVVWQKAWFTKENLHTEFPLADELSFQAEYKMSASLVSWDDTPTVFALGATEQLLNRCTHRYDGVSTHKLTPAKQQSIQESMVLPSAQWKRVLGLSFKHISRNTIQPEEDFSNMVFVWYIVMTDPLRPEVKDAVEKCQQAWIRILMLTGDHKSTATAIAQELWLLNENSLIYSEEELAEMDEKQLYKILPHLAVCARCTPRRKMQILGMLQKKGEIVAMTGDGVNDAPALKKANVGIAMWKMGTDVARESAEIILMDDNFATIVTAIEHGRIIFNNIKKSCNIALNRIFSGIWCLAGMMMMSETIPFIAIQLLRLNLVTETITGIWLAFEKAEWNELSGRMNTLNEPFISWKTLPFLLVNATAMIALTLGVYYRFISQGSSHLYASTVAFLIIYFTQFFNLFNLRSFSISFFRLNTNRVIRGGMIVSVIFQCLALYWAPLQQILQFSAVPREVFVTMFALSASVLFVGEVYKRINSYRRVHVQ